MTACASTHGSNLELDFDSAGFFKLQSDRHFIAGFEWGVELPSDYELIDEISSFFSLDDSDSEKVIGRWVENTLQMRVTNTNRSARIALVEV